MSWLRSGAIFEIIMIKICTRSAENVNKTSECEVHVTINQHPPCGVLCKI